MTSLLERERESEGERKEMPKADEEMLGEVER